MAVIGGDDYMVLVDRAFDGMAAIVAGLGDERANARPDLAGANSPYGLLHHCLGLTGWWAVHVVAGGEVARDKAGELVAVGPVAPLVARIPAVRDELAAVVASTRPGDPVRGRPADKYAGTPIGTSAGAALLHVLEELAQHHGQMEIIRDLLLAGS